MALFALQNLCVSSVLFSISVSLSSHFLPPLHPHSLSLFRSPFNIFPSFLFSNTFLIFFFFFYFLLCSPASHSSQVTPSFPLLVPVFGLYTWPSRAKGLDTLSCTYIHIQRTSAPVTLLSSNPLSLPLRLT
ncbi:hypothetical protein BJY00DRAFT_246808 [Aspergillus carlsbadensis]|nr:hypothetical protein BJY00DRAFT_246808 [Aspergillus carlsbadensis]